MCVRATVILMSMSSDNLSCAMRACPHLRQLSLSHCSGVTDTTLDALSRHCPAIETLDLSGCTAITDTGVTSLSHGRCATCLAHLNLSACPLLTDAGVRLIAEHCHKALHTLYLRWCPLITTAAITEVVDRCTHIVVVTPAAPFNILLLVRCHADAARAARLRINVRCDRCGATIFSRIRAADAMIGDGSQAHLANEFYTNIAPSNPRLVDVSAEFRVSPNGPLTMRNCPQNCHFRGPGD